VALLFGVLLGLAGTPAAASGPITEYPLACTDFGTAGCFPAQPAGIAAGPDNALWFAEYGTNKIGRTTTAGAVTEYSIPTECFGVKWACNPYGITAGPDGAMWFTEANGNRIGRITTSGTIADYPVTTASSDPRGIVAGPDGALWFVEQAGNKIGQITTAGAVTEYPIPTGASNSFEIAKGPDGALWFVEQSGNKIGRITTAGAVTEYPIPTTDANPYGIAAGTDGALWFTEVTANKIGRITTAGGITEYPIPTASSSPGGITASADGTLWFNEAGANNVGRITTGGTFLDPVPIPSANSGSREIATGPDGGLWFTEHNTNRLARLDVGACGSAGAAAASACGGNPCPVRFIPGTTEPRLAVIVVNGVQTSTPNDDYYPVDLGFETPRENSAVESYCSPYTASSGRYPPSVSGQLQGYVGTVNPPPPEGTEILPDRLAQEGAVLLPYSYRGAYFSSCPRGTGRNPLFHVNYSDSSDPGNTDANAQASWLYGEVQSVHNCWPDSPIEIVADSGGGVPAEYYWNTAFQSERDNVTHIFTLDAPINGLDHTSIESIVDNHLGPPMRDFYSQLWENLDDNDEHEIALDSDGAFRPIGTIGDYAYVLGNMRWSFNFDPKGNDEKAALNALLSQLLMKCDHGVFTDTCEPTFAFNFVSPCSGTRYSGDPSHEVVRICKPTVDYITGITETDASAAAGSGQRGGDRPTLEAARAASPVRRVPGPGPAFQLILFAAEGGDIITIHGHGLGTGGSVRFSGPHGLGSVAGSVRAWSTSAISVAVPASAASGPVLVRLSDGGLYFASSLALLEPNRVRHLRVNHPRRAPGGSTQHVRVTASGANGEPVAHARVSLFDGASERPGATNAKGSYTFRVTDFGQREGLVHSGSVAVPLRLTWGGRRGTIFESIAFGLLKTHVSRRAAISLTIAVPSAGSLMASARAKIATKKPNCPNGQDKCVKSIAYGKASQQAHRLGQVVLTIKPTKAATKSLARTKRGLVVRVRVVFHGMSRRRAAARVFAVHVPRGAVASEP
jgi:virginiamycin B lyase